MSLVTGLHLNINLWPIILSVTNQPIPYPLSGPSTKSMSLQCSDEDVMWEECQVLCMSPGRWHQLLFLYPPTLQLCQMVTKFVRYYLPLVKPWWLSSAILSLFMYLNTVSRRTCSMILPSTEARPIGLELPRSSFFPRLKKKQRLFSPFSSYWELHQAATTSEIRWTVAQPLLKTTLNMHIWFPCFKKQNGSKCNFSATLQASQATTILYGYPQQVIEHCL